MEHARFWIELSAASVESSAVAITIRFIVIATVQWLINRGLKTDGAYERYRVAVWKSLLAGLDLLVAADIIRTVALDTSLMSIGTLSALVLIRTFLGWTLTIEFERRRSWQRSMAVPEPHNTVHSSYRECSPGERKAWWRC